MSPARSSSAMISTVEEVRQSLRALEGTSFWIERVDFAILSLSWLIRPTLWDWVDDSTWAPFWFSVWLSTSFTCTFTSLIGLALDPEPEDELSVPSYHETSLPPGVTPLVRDLKGKDKEQKPVAKKHELYLVKSPGFWLERLGLIIFLLGIIYRKKEKPRGDLMVNTCLSVIFPLANIYYAWFSYFKEFSPELPSGDQAIEEQELELKRIDVIESNKQEEDTNMESKAKPEHMHERNQESDHGGRVNKAIVRQEHELKSRDAIESDKRQDKNMESNLALEHKHERNQESDHI